MSKRYFRKSGTGKGSEKTEWIEMNREEYREFVASPEGKGRFFIDMDDIVLEATESEAESYREEKNHHDYIKRQEKGWITISIYEAEKEKGFSGEEIFGDESQMSVEDEVAARMETESLKEALSVLDSASYTLIYELYLAEKRKTEREAAKEIGISQSVLNRRKKKILEKMGIKIKKSQQ